jgi:hypothetical protein
LLFPKTGYSFLWIPLSVPGNRPGKTADREGELTDSRKNPPVKGKTVRRNSQKTAIIVLLLQPLASPGKILRILLFLSGSCSGTEVSEQLY